MRGEVIAKAVVDFIQVRMPDNLEYSSQTT